MDINVVPLTEEGSASALSSGFRVRVLGDVTVERNGVLMQPREWPRASARLLCALLILHPQGLTRDEIRAMLWPEHEPEAASSALTTALSALRRVFAGPGQRRCSHLPVRDNLIRFHWNDADRVDLHVFVRPANPAALATAELADLVALYRGSLLPEYRYADWAMGRREEARTRWHVLSMHLVQRLVGLGQADTALIYLQRLLDDEPTHEEAGRMMMRLLAQGGRRGAAVQVYDRKEAALEGDVGMQPEAATMSVVDELRQPAAVSSPRLAALPVSAPTASAQSLGSPSVSARLLLADATRAFERVQIQRCDTIARHAQR